MKISKKNNQHHHIRLGHHRNQNATPVSAGIAMGILGVDDLSGDAPLMEAGLDSLCLFCMISYGPNGLQIGWLVGWMVGQGGLYIGCLVMFGCLFGDSLLVGENWSH